MPTYIVVTPLRNGGDKPLPPGEPVDLDQREGDALTAIGALSRPTGCAPAAPPPDTAPPAAPRTPREKPIGQQTKVELHATAAREGVEVRADATNAQIVAAIEAARKQPPQE